MDKGEKSFKEVIQRDHLINQKQQMDWNIQSLCSDSDIFTSAYGKPEQENLAVLLLHFLAPSARWESRYQAPALSFLLSPKEQILSCRPHLHSAFCITLFSRKVSGELILIILLSYSSCFHTLCATLLLY